MKEKIKAMRKKRTVVSILNQYKVGMYIEAGEYESMLEEIRAIDSPRT